MTPTVYMLGERQDLGLRVITTKLNSADPASTMAAPLCGYLSLVRNRILFTQYSCGERVKCFTKPLFNKFSVALDHHERSSTC